MDFNPDSREFESSPLSTQPPYLIQVLHVHVKFHAYQKILVASHQHYDVIKRKYLVSKDRMLHLEYFFFFSLNLLSIFPDPVTSTS